jgi:hypothetical protein
MGPPVGTPQLRARLLHRLRRTKAMPAKRKLIKTGTDKRYVRRNKQGQFKESDDVGRSLAADRRQKAKTISKPGQGDKGDRRTAKKTSAKK